MARRSALVLALIAFSLAACGPLHRQATPPSHQHATRAASWVTYRSRMYGVTLRHPTGWKPVSGYRVRIGGQGGYLQLLCLDGAGWTARQAALHEADHILHPFGAHPKIVPVEMAGQAGFLILPSNDADLAGQPRYAEIVVPYPKVWTIDGHRYHFLLLDATPPLIRKIGATVRFTQ